MCIYKQFSISRLYKVLQPLNAVTVNVVLLLWLDEHTHTHTLMNGKYIATNLKKRTAKYGKDYLQSLFNLHL